MFPNAVMMKPQTWNDILRRHDRGPRRARLAAVIDGRMSAMSNQKPLNIGLVGYGFMGRTHSNAFRQVNHFFDLDLPAGAQGGLRRATTRRRKAFAEQWGYESIETDWRKLLSSATTST